jgi:hypothetical protein
MRWLNTNYTIIIIAYLIIILCYNDNTIQENNKGVVTSFTILCMIRRRGGQGDLQRILNDENDDTTINTKERKIKSKNNINQGKGQLITGVTLPKEVCSIFFPFKYNDRNVTTFSNDDVFFWFSC